MKEEVIKRTIRVPKELYERLEWKSEAIGKTINQVILEDLGRMYGIDVGDRKRGRRWY